MSSTAVPAGVSLTTEFVKDFHCTCPPGKTPIDCTCTEIEDEENSPSLWSRLIGSAKTPAQQAKVASLAGTATGTQVAPNGRTWREWLGSIFGSNKTKVNAAATVVAAAALKKKQEEEAALKKKQEEEAALKKKQEEEAAAAAAAATAATAAASFVSPEIKRKITPLPKDWKYKKDPTSNKIIYIDPTGKEQFDHPSIKDGWTTEIDNSTKTITYKKTGEADTTVFPKKPRANPTSSSASTPTLPDGWKSSNDPKSGKLYYYKEKDPSKTQWEFPTESSTPVTSSSASTPVTSSSASTPVTSSSASTPVTLPDGWKSSNDPKSGKLYYYKEKDPSKTQWEFPTESSTSGTNSTGSASSLRIGGARKSRNRKSRKNVSHNKRKSRKHRRH